MYGHRECEAAHLPDDAISYREFGMKDYNACAIYDEYTRGLTHILNLEINSYFKF